jgi:hypothetical protein
MCPPGVPSCPVNGPRHIAPTGPISGPVIIGIDDFTWRQVQHYGTIVCDLERPRIIDRSPDRNQE